MALAIAAISPPSDLKRRMIGICSTVARIRRPQIELPQWKHDSLEGPIQERFTRHTLWRCWLIRARLAAGRVTDALDGYE